MNINAFKDIDLREVNRDCVDVLKNVLYVDKYRDWLRSQDNEQIKKLDHDKKVGDPEKIGNVGNKIEQQSLENGEKDLSE